MGVRLPRGHQDGVQLRRRPEKIEEYGWFVNNAEKPQAVGKRSRTRGAFLTCTATSPSGAVDHYAADTYAKAPAGKPGEGPVVLPTEKEYSYVARGGSWDDDVDRLRSASRIASNLEWSVQDPNRPQSIWWHTGRHVRRVPGRPGRRRTGQPQGGQIPRD